MLRITAIKGNAAAYYGGNNADYYAEGQKVTAYWHGEASKMLGLHGEVQQRDFSRLMSNQKPNGEQLTAINRGERRQAYDFTFSVPKSVTILHSIARDPRIEQSLRFAANATMHEIEREAKVRVRKGGVSEDRITGNMVWGDFVHETTRPLGGIPDPHLHLHAVAANATWDNIEGKWKALQVGDIKANADYYQAFFRQTLAEQLQSHGYILKNTGKDFEVEGIPERAIAEFSRRTKQIEELNKKLASTRGYDSLSPETKAKLGATSREKKTTGLTRDDLQSIWVSRLTDSEHRAIYQTFHDSMFRNWKKVERNKEAMDYAVFTHKETYVPIKKILTTAAYFDVTQTSPEGLRDEVNVRMQRGQFLRKNYRDEEWMTTKKAIDKEKFLIDLWKQPTKWDGRKRYTVKRPGISKEAKKILGSRDRVKSFRGLVGTRYGGVMADVMASLPDAVVLDQPTMDEVIAASIHFPDQDIVIFEEPRKDEPRQGAADVLEDFLGVKPITFSERKFDPLPLIKTAISTLTRRRYYEGHAEREPERTRNQDRVPSKLER